MVERLERTCNEQRYSPDQACCFVLRRQRVGSGMRGLLKRWWFWSGLGLIFVAMMAGYLLIPVVEPRITQANCDKIQMGWSPEQVINLLGEHEMPGGYPEWAVEI